MTKKTRTRSKKQAQLKEEAQKYIDTIAESNMSEMQLEGKHYNEQLQQLEKYLQKKAIITKSQYDAAVLDANSAFNKNIETISRATSQRGRVSTKKNKSVKTKTAQDAWSRYRLLLTRLILQA